MSPRGAPSSEEPRPTDGEVVYRTRWRAELAEAAAATARRGIPTVTQWSDTHMPAGVHGRRGEGDGEGRLIVPATDAARARTVLSDWRAAGEERIRAHLPDVRRQLGLLLLVALLATGILLAFSPFPRQQPAWAVVYGALVVALALYVLRSWRRSRRPS